VIVCYLGHALMACQHGLIIDADVISVNIERTRFPVPDNTDHQETGDYPGLVRAADLIGQLADPQHMRKFPALFHEFEETETNARLGFNPSMWPQLSSPFARFFVFACLYRFSPSTYWTR
jgi:hypothetical protein